MSVVADQVIPSEVGRDSNVNNNEREAYSTSIKRN
jgi:hypothetical protein